MKKKIVYISGAETFDVADVRAAFEEVRNTLNLDKDTILFGVPVDESIAESETNKIEDVVVPTEEPIRKRAKKVKSAIESTVVAQENIIEDTKQKSQKDDDIETVVDVDVVESEKNKKKSNDVSVSIPILSVLASNPDVAPDVEADIATETINDFDIESKITDSDNDDIADMLNDEMPMDSEEKTLEELLETMAPLREDVHPELADNTETEDSKLDSDDMDITLENLASEFAETQDKIVAPKKSSERGKIGKLKNILPFKKMKRDDSGLMGDLFGWAGIAANDDDFAMPGFFTGTSAKK